MNYENDRCASLRKLWFCEIDSNELNFDWSILLNFWIIINGLSLNCKFRALNYAQLQKRQ